MLRATDFSDNETRDETICPSRVLTLTNMYITATEPRANGAAILRVLTGFLVSARA